MRLSKEFYNQNAMDAAMQLVGKLLCRKLDNKIIKLRITETECYYGEDDTACHAHKGKTERTKILYEKGGYAYVYLCYGIHNLLNVVTGEKDIPQAVLIRCAEGYNGPGKLTKALSVTREQNGIDLITSDILWLEDDDYICKVKTEKRVGINYADEKDINRLWRYVMVKE